jgi:hypothetical protein
MQASIIVTSGSKVNVACPWIGKTLLKAADTYEIQV